MNIREQENFIDSISKMSHDNALEKKSCVNPVVLISLECFQEDVHRSKHFANDNFKDHQFSEIKFLNEDDSNEDDFFDDVTEFSSILESIDNNEIESERERNASEQEQAKSTAKKINTFLGENLIQENEVLKGGNPPQKPELMNHYSNHLNHSQPQETQLKKLTSLSKTESNITTQPLSNFNSPKLNRDVSLSSYGEISARNIESSIDRNRPQVINEASNKTHTNHDQSFNFSLLDLEKIESLKKAGVLTLNQLSNRYQLLFNNDRVESLIIDNFQQNAIEFGNTNFTEERISNISDQTFETLIQEGSIQKKNPDGTSSKTPFTDNEFKMLKEEFKSLFIKILISQGLLLVVDPEKNEKQVFVVSYLPSKLLAQKNDRKNSELPSLIEKSPKEKSRSLEDLKKMIETSLINRWSRAKKEEEDKLEHDLKVYDILKFGILKEKIKLEDRTKEISKSEILTKTIFGQLKIESSVLLIS